MWQAFHQVDPTLSSLSDATRDLSIFLWGLWCIWHYTVFSDPMMLPKHCARATKGQHNWVWGNRGVGTKEDISGAKSKYLSLEASVLNKFTTHTHTYHITYTLTYADTYTHIKPKTSPSLSVFYVSSNIYREKPVSDLSFSLNDFISLTNQATSCFSATSYFTKFTENTYE